ncbi:MAG: DUF3313 domain-containing protein [Gammaproteobacteria bacterium]|nr:DUF3313 domain-containing protein [Gammaproteobacteria bacterium]
MNARQIFVVISAVSAFVLAQGVLAQQPMRPYDKTFLTNYDQLKPRAGKAGKPGDLAYIAPNALKRLAAYKAVMVDQPEILFSADSDIKGMKPDDQKALAEAMRDALSGRLAAGGYAVAQQPGPGVLYLRVGLTDLMVSKKKRNILAYTPMGAVVKLGADAVRDALSKVDFIEMTFQAELVDSVSNDVLGAIVAERGTRKGSGQKETRIDIDEFNQNMFAWGNRLRCQLDNAKLPADKQTDCTDDAGNATRYADKK